MDFEYFFFKPLDLKVFIETFSLSSSNCSADQLKESYTRWIINHCRKAQCFYQFQYRKHSEVTWAAFCLAASLPEYEHPDNFGLEIEWLNWKEEYRLDQHYDQYQDIKEQLACLQETAQKNISARFSVIEETIPNREIDRIWFHQVINNSPQRIAELKKTALENYEKYRQTTHWKRIRAVSLLISNAVCQAKECSMIGESWYGGNESDVEVHHISYSNIGNENFDDLVVLCRRHHQLIHQNLKALGNLDQGVTANSFQ